MPYRLPPDTGDFTGRSGAVTELAGVLAAGRSMPVAAVGGMGGIGKTTLAVHVAHLLRTAVLRTAVREPARDGRPPRRAARRARRAVASARPA